MLTPREKSPLPENVPRGGSNPQRCGQRAQTLPTSYSGPPYMVFTVFGMACEVMNRLFQREVVCGVCCVQDGLFNLLSTR